MNNSIKAVKESAKTGKVIVTTTEKEVIKLLNIAGKRGLTIPVPVTEAQSGRLAEHIKKKGIIKLEKDAKKEEPSTTVDSGAGGEPQDEGSTLPDGGDTEENEVSGEGEDMDTEDLGSGPKEEDGSGSGESSVQGV
jgi:hypothetical protein